MGVGMIVGLGKLYRDLQNDQLQRTQPRNPWDLN
jgi:hypothetical protein